MIANIEVEYIQNLHRPNFLGLTMLSLSSFEELPQLQSPILYISYLEIRRKE